MQSALDGHSVPTQVHALELRGRGHHQQPSAAFEVDFTPQSRSDHIVRVTFNDEDVPGNQLIREHTYYVHIVSLISASNDIT